MRVQHQHIRVFFEGIEFQGVNSVTITEQEQMPPSCEITLGYRQRIQNILPKTLCHVFYKHNNEYVLIFEGELTGLSFEKNAMLKACKLQFTGLTLNWRSHYIVTKDIQSRFDKGAFLVANEEMPLTYDKEPVRHANQVPVGEWNEWYTGINNLLGNLDSTLTRNDMNTILENGTPRFRKDIFWALAHKEASATLHFAKNEATADARDPVADTKIYVANLTSTPEPADAWNITKQNMYEYPGLALSLKKGGRDQSRYGETAWGILQVMGFNFPDNLDKLQKHLLINGLIPEYRDRVAAVTGLRFANGKDIYVKVDSPIAGTDFQYFRDQKRGGKLFAIPSEPLLFALQCKVAWNLITSDGMMPKLASPNFDKNDITAIKKLFGRWLGKEGEVDAHNTSPEGYREEVYAYFAEANERFYPTDPNPPVPHNMHTVPEHPFTGAEVADNETLIYRDEDKVELATDEDETTGYPKWIKMIAAGAQILAKKESLLATEIQSLSLNELFTGIINSLSISSLYYSKLFSSLKLKGSRINVIDNGPARELFSLTGFSKFALDQVTHQPMGILSGMELFKIFTEVVNYNIIEYSAPFTKELASVVITPDTTFMPPVLPNTFFSDQLNDFQFNRQMEGEPTRYVGYTDPMAFTNTRGSNSTIDMRMTFVTPKIPNVDADEDFTRTGNSEIRKIRQYTYEETWRGVHAQQGTTEGTAFENMMFTIFEPDKPEDGEKVEPVTIDDAAKKAEEPLAKDFLTKYWKSMINGMFLRKRYSTRNCTLTAVYNPNRVCGFPGIVIDEELPAVIGRITNIATSISAEGQSISQISMSECHTHWDEDLEKLDVGNTNTYNYARDALPSIDHIYKYLWTGNESNYRWYNIGKQVFAPLLGFDPDKDYSLLRFADAEFLDKQDDAKKVVDWENYAKAIASSVKNLRQLYNSFNNKNDLSDEIISRQLLTMSEYWTALTGESQIDQTKHYKAALYLQEYADHRNSSDSVKDYYNNAPFSSERRNKIVEFMNVVSSVNLEGNPNV